MKTKRRRRSGLVALIKRIGQNIVALTRHPRFAFVATFVVTVMLIAGAVVVTVKDNEAYYDALGKNPKYKYGTMTISQYIEEQNLLYNREISWLKAQSEYNRYLKDRRTDSAINAEKLCRPYRVWEMILIITGVISLGFAIYFEIKYEQWEKRKQQRQKRQQQRQKQQ